MGCILWVRNLPEVLLFSSLYRVTFNRDMSNAYSKYRAQVSRDRDGLNEPDWILRSLTFPWWALDILDKPTRHTAYCPSCWWHGNANVSGFLKQQSFNSLRPRPNRRHFADDILKCIFLNENVWISIKISLKFVPKGPINNIPALVQIMAWRRPGEKPLSEPMMVRLPTHIWVKFNIMRVKQCTTFIKNFCSDTALIARFMGPT